MPNNNLRNLIDAFFCVAPNRFHFVYSETGEQGDADTFVVVTRGLDATAFGRVAGEDCGPGCGTC